MAKNDAPKSLQDKFSELEDVLNHELIERRPEVAASMLSLIGGTHIFLLGPPGTAKSMTVERIERRISGTRAFNILMTRFTTPEEVFGPVSLKGLENDEFIRKTDGYLAESEVAFVDEIFKANSAILNSLLWGINERKYRHGNNIIDIPLSTLFCASNELPQDEMLSALYDRLLFRFQVSPISDNASFLKMLKTKRDVNPEPLLSWDEVEQAKAEAAKVIITDEVFNGMADIRHKLRAENIEPTERRFVESMKVIKAAAWRDGEVEADLEHLRPLKDILWEMPDQRRTVLDIVTAVASPLDQEALTLLDDLKRLREDCDRIEKNGQVDPQAKKREGMALHQKTKRAKQDLKALSERSKKRRRPSEPMQECKKVLIEVTEYLLHNVFNMEDGVGIDGLEVD